MNNVTQRKRAPLEPLIVAIAGGGGGIGRSTLAVELGRLLVRKGRRVLLVDADLQQALLHTRLDLDPQHGASARVDNADGIDLGALIIEGDRSRPAVLPLARARRRPLEPIELRARTLVDALRLLDQDFVIIDLPAAPGPFAAMAFALADIPIALASTEPASLYSTTNLLRAALTTSLTLHADAATTAARLDDALCEAGPEWRIAELRDAFQYPALLRMLEETLQRFQPYFVLTHARENVERESVHLAALAFHYLVGVRPRVLGHIDFDERRWFHLRNENTNAPLASEQGAGALIEELARKLAEIEVVDRDQPRGVPLERVHPVHAVGLHPSASASEIRAAYRRLWEGLRRESTITRRLLGPRLRDVVLREVEQANIAIQRWLAERSTTATETTTAPLSVAPGVRAHPGEPIQRARKQRQISQRELSLRTRIDLRYLEAIERFEVETLPRPVYLGGYLREIARALDLDAEPLVENYVEALGDARRGKILTKG